MVLCALGVFAAAFLLPVFFTSQIVSTVSSSADFLTIFALSVVALKICFDESNVTLLFCGIIAYTTQHIAFSTYDYIVGVTGIGTVNLYGDTEQTVNALTALVYFGIYAVIYWFVWAFIEHKIRRQENLKVDKLLLFSFAAVLIVDVVLSITVTYFMSDELSKVGLSVIYMYRLMSTVFVYLMLYSMLSKRLAEAELETVESLWRQDRKNYELSRENIESINIKCHDLKHQIRKLKGGEETVDEEFLSELENSVTIYDNQIKTGNEAFDLILAENSIYMAKHGIRLSVIADGESLSFMSDADVYSLFGNAVHNAMEAVAKLEDMEKRVIRLHVRKEKNMLVICVENPCENVLMGNDGLPMTNKREYGHGYGMRSMRHIAEKYGGFTGVEIKNGAFILDIMIPVPDQRGNKKGIS